MKKPKQRKKKNSKAGGREKIEGKTVKAFSSI